MQRLQQAQASLEGKLAAHTKELADLELALHAAQAEGTDQEACALREALKVQLEGRIARLEQLRQTKEDRLTFYERMEPPPGARERIVASLAEVPKTAALEAPPSIGAGRTSVDVDNCSIDVDEMD